METERAFRGEIGVVGPEIRGACCVGLGVYFFVCATWFKSFLLYRLKAQFGPFSGRSSHTYYQIMGLALIAGGIANFLGVFGD